MRLFSQQRADKSFVIIAILGVETGKTGELWTPGSENVVSIILLATDIVPKSLLGVPPGRFKLWKRTTFYKYFSRLVSVTYHQPQGLTTASFYFRKNWPIHWCKWEVFNNPSNRGLYWYSSSIDLSFSPFSNPEIVSKIQNLERCIKLSRLSSRNCFDLYCSQILHPFDTRIFAPSTVALISFPFTVPTT